MSDPDTPQPDPESNTITTRIVRKSSTDSQLSSHTPPPLGLGPESVSIPSSSPFPTNQSSESPSQNQQVISSTPSSPVVLPLPTSSPSNSSGSQSSNSLIMFRLDPCGVICILITYMSVFYADYVVVRWICLVNFNESAWCLVHIIGFNLIVILLSWSHLRAVVTDPGIIDLPDSRLDFSEYYEAMKEKMESKSSSGIDMEDDFNDWTVCARCEVYRPPRAHHCRICKRCVRRMDHHCPWINNCVGQWNQKYFIQFLIYVGALCTYASVLILYAWTTSNCLPSGNGCAKLDLIDKQSKVLHSVILMLECIIFGMFVLAILIDQLTAIFTDCSAVEQVKRRTANHHNNHNPHDHDSSTTSTSIHRSSCPPPSKKSKLKLLGEVCGRGPIYYWVLPCHNNSFHQQQQVKELKKRRNYGESPNSSNSGYFNV